MNKRDELRTEAAFDFMVKQKYPPKTDTPGMLIPRMDVPPMMADFALAHEKAVLKRVAAELRDREQHWQMLGHGDVDCTDCRYIEKLEAEANGQS